jgi:hypothetical protein
MTVRWERTPVPRGRSWVLGLVLMTSMLVLSPDATAAASGTLLWASRYDGPEHTYDSASAIVASPDGTTVFLTGESGGGSADYATIALDASTGARLWARTYDGPVQGLDQAIDIAVGPGGARVFVTGYSDARHGLGSATIAYDASTGSTLWTRRHRGGSRALTVSPDGSEVFVVGFAPDAAGSGDDYATFAYDAGTGATLWSRRYQGAALDGFATAVMATSETVFVTGPSAASGAASDFTTVSYDAMSGSKLWARRYDGPAHGNDLAVAVVASADGSRVFVTGQSDDGTGTADFATVAYGGTTGASLWSARYGTPDRELVSAAAAAPDGSAVFITGAVTTPASGQDFTTIAYGGARGSRRWVRRYAGPGLSFDTGESIAVSAASTTVYVTGRAVPDPVTHVSVATFAYDASTGSTVWSRFFTRVSGWGRSIDLSPDASEVFVCGFVTEPPEDFTDAIALAYAA